jgi:hypothetical protein
MPAVLTLYGIASSAVYDSRALKTEMLRPLFEQLGFRRLISTRQLAKPQANSGRIVPNNGYLFAWIGLKY